MVCLVPELCAMTGLTDAARSDFKVMKVSTFGLHGKQGEWLQYQVAASNPVLIAFDIKL